MALNNIIRTTLSKLVVPLAIRRGGKIHFHNHSSTYFATTQSRNMLQKSSFLHHNHFSTNPSSDNSLLRIIESEIHYAEECQQEEEDEREPIPADFPFHIRDYFGKKTITLTKRYQDETISIEVHMPSEDNEDYEGEGKGNLSILPFTVRVSKKSGPCLEFDCVAYPFEIAIETLSVKDLEKNSKDQIAYGFSALDENKQQFFHMYLEMRGIEPEMTNFMHRYMIDKDRRQYIRWLKKLHKFVSL